MRYLARIVMFLETMDNRSYQGLGMGERRVVIKRIYVGEDENVLDIAAVITTL